MKSFERKTKLEKHELEKKFKALALVHYNNNLPEGMSVDENNIGFQSYLDAMIWGMIEKAEIQSWVEFYERKLASNE
jgi:hypothetical protein